MTDWLACDFAQRALIAGVLVALMCAVFAFFVVLRRMAFVGAGVSHAALGGVAIGLTGTKAEIDRVVSLFRASYEIIPTPQSAAKYTVAHTTWLYALDARGRTRIRCPDEASVDEIVAGIRTLLAYGA
jgi:hypothetical protein